jgi:Tol biopolymer transport system component
VLPRGWLTWTCARVLLLALCLVAGCARPEATPSSPSSRPEGGLPTLAPDVAATGEALVVRGNRLWASDRTGQFAELARAPAGGTLQDPTWHPKARRAAYSVFAPLPTPAPGRQLSGLSASDIWEVEPGASARVLVQHDGDEVRLTEPAWSPDGAEMYLTHSAVVRSGSAVVGLTRRIERASVSGSTRQAIASDAHGVSPSPDGESVVYLRALADAAQELWIQRRASGATLKLGDGRFVDVTSPRFSPDGRTVAFMGALAVDNPQAATAGGWLIDRLVSRAEAHGFLYGLWLIRSDGSALRRVGTATFDTPTVRWAGDGQRLLVFDETGLHRMEIASGERTTLLVLDSYAGFDWRPRS